MMFFVLVLDIEKYKHPNIDQRSLPMSIYLIILKVKCISLSCTIKYINKILIDTHLNQNSLVLKKS